MKRTKANRWFNTKTQKWEYERADIIDFHCNIKEYFNNNKGRSTFFTQLNNYLFGTPIFGGIKADCYYDKDYTNSEKIAKVVETVTGRKPIVKDHIKDNLCLDCIYIEFPNTKIPKLTIDFYRFLDDKRWNSLHEECVYYDNENGMKLVYKTVLDGIYMLFQNMTSDWGKEHPNYFSPSSSFTYSYGDWRVVKNKNQKS